MIVIYFLAGLFFYAYSALQCYWMVWCLKQKSISMPIWKESNEIITNGTKWLKESKKKGKRDSERMWVLELNKYLHHIEKHLLKMHKIMESDLQALLSLLIFGFRVDKAIAKTLITNVCEIFCCCGFILYCLVFVYCMLLLHIWKRKWHSISWEVEENKRTKSSKKQFPSTEFNQVS